MSKIRRDREGREIVYEAYPQIFVEQYDSDGNIVSLPDDDWETYIAKHLWLGLYELFMECTEDDTLSGNSFMALGTYDELNATYFRYYPDGFMLYFLLDSDDWPDLWERNYGKTATHRITFNKQDERITIVKLKDVLQYPGDGSHMRPEYYQEALKRKLATSG